MGPTRRRSLLAAVGATAVAGCLEGAPTGSTAERSTAADATEPDTGDETTEGWTEEATVRLAAVDGLATGHSIRVHPRPLAGLLERGAATDEEVRTTDAMILLGEPPILAGERTVRLAGEAVDDGAYALDIDGGVLYEWLLGATAVEDPPADAEIVDIGELSDDRRTLVVTAIRNGRATVEPQTPLGTWARRAFVGGYVRYEGTVYRGRERQQTDAAFFSSDVWYVASVTPTDGASTDAPTLRLDPLPPPAVGSSTTCSATGHRLSTPWKRA